MEVFNNEEITPEFIEQAATLFSEHYGIWGPLGPKPGERIKMSASKLKEQILPGRAEGEEKGQYRLVRMVCDGEVVGQAFGCYWVCHRNEETPEAKIGVCWITQLVVKKSWRGMGIAKKLLCKLEMDGVGTYGILSSSAFAIRAAWRVFGNTKEFDENVLAHSEMAQILRSAPIPYIRNAQRREGTLFDTPPVEGSICSAFTDFFIDHAEPREALQKVKARGTKWPLGDLDEGCEFLYITRN